MSLLEMAEMVTKLTNPHRTVFERVFIDEERFSVVAKSLGQSERAIQVLYEEALDMLAKGLGPE
jgi:DNA-directed RNA polymerase specialized sigma24 family protein